MDFVARSIGDSTSSDAMQMVGNKLSKLAEDFKVLFEFDVVAIFACDVQLQNLRVQSREALAVNFAFMLHQMPDESVITQNQRDRLLNLTQTFSNSFHVCLKLWTIITKQCLSQ